MKYFGNAKSCLKTEKYKCYSAICLGHIAAIFVYLLSPDPPLLLPSTCSVPVLITSDILYLRADRTAYHLSPRLLLLSSCNLIWCVSLMTKGKSWRERIGPDTDGAKEGSMVSHSVLDFPFFFPYLFSVQGGKEKEEEKKNLPSYFYYHHGVIRERPRWLVSAQRRVDSWCVCMCVWLEPSLKSAGNIFLFFFFFFPCDAVLLLWGLVCCSWMSTRGSRAPWKFSTERPD